MSAIFMNPLPKNTGLIFMNKIAAKSNIIFMSKKGVLPEPPGIEEGTGEDTGHVWSVINYYGFYSFDFTTSWNEMVGNYTGAEGLLYLPGANYVKVVPTSGSLTYASGSVYMGALGCKTAIQYKSAGTGGSTQATMTTYPTAAAAQSAWLSTPAILQLGADKKFAFGFQLNVTSGRGGAVFFTIYSSRA